MQPKSTIDKIKTEVLVLVCQLCNKPIDNKDFKSAIRTLLKKASANNALRRNLFKKTAR